MSSRAETARNHVVSTPLLIGYIETDFGLGEYAKGLATALDEAKVPFSIYPYKSYSRRGREESQWVQWYDVQNAHSINIFCMATDQTKNARRILGKQHVEKSYNILSTFWELPRAPESWRSDLDFFDELWTPSHFVADSFRPIFSKSISVIPPCINLDATLSTNRAKFGLDATRFYFLFSFDLNSYPARKNPLAVAQAFEVAFSGRQEDIGLIFKINGARNLYPHIMSELESAAKRDPRIVIFYGEWHRADVVALLASIDCYVSLHRSEGFGLGMAESLFLGKSVIGTAFSGNIEFLTPETGYPIPYQMRSVKEDEYPHHAGNLWAEPDVQIAARIMHSVASMTDEVRIKALRGQAFVRQHYSSKTVGSLVAARLREITARLQ